MRKGFSLVELSIVLVILGLLVGGILAGQSLIRASELRAVGTESSRYRTAFLAFRDKYFAVPGDMLTATSVWGDDNTNCPDAAIANGTPGTCNGNGDGNIDKPAAASTTGENYQAWKQLALAGLIEGTYTGIVGSGGVFNMIPSINTPSSKLGGGSWYVYWRNNTGGALFLQTTYNNVLQFGAVSANNENYAAAITPTEAWNIDTKLDDGQPGYGKVIAINWSNTCTSSTVAPSANTKLDAYYRLDDNTLRCALAFRNFP